LDEVFKNCGRKACSLWVDIILVTDDDNGVSFFHFPKEYIYLLRRLENFQVLLSTEFAAEDYFVVMLKGFNKIPNLISVCLNSLDIKSENLD